MIVRVPKKVPNPGPIKGPGNKPLRGRKRKGYALFHDFFFVLKQLERIIWVWPKVTNLCMTKLFIKVVVSIGVNGVSSVQAFALLYCFSINPTVAESISTLSPALRDGVTSPVRILAATSIFSANDPELSISLMYFKREIFSLFYGCSSRRCSLFTRASFLACPTVKNFPTRSVCTGSSLYFTSFKNFPTVERMIFCFLRSPA